MSDQGTASPAANGDAGNQQQQQQEGPSGGGGVGPNGGPPVSRLRQSQYAEAIANPLPELAVVPELEPVSNFAAMECDDTASSTRAVVQPDNIGDPRSAAVVYAGEEPSKWRKYRTPVIVALIIAVIILVGTVVGVVVSNGNKDRSAVGSPSASMTTNSATPTMTTGSSSMSSSSSTSATASPSSVPSECADSSKFLTSVSFMGVKGLGDWKTDYYGSAKNSKECCAYCYQSVPKGCNSWAYLPSSGFVGTTCTFVYGWDTGDNKDSTCPAGHDAPVYFVTDSDNSTDVGFTGPCGATDD